MPGVFNRAKRRLLDGSLDLSTASLRVLLLQSGYTFDPDHDFVAALTPGSNELTVAGYARQALAGLAVVEDDTNDRAGATATEVSFGALAAGETITQAVIFEFITNDADSELVCHFAVGSIPTNGGTVTLRFGGASPGDFLRALNS